MAGGMISLSSILSPAAFASYQSSQPSSPAGPTGSTATRGIGCGHEKPFLKALAPVGHIGHTSASHPTFTWYVPDQKSYPLELTLFEEGPTGRGPLVRKMATLSSTPGIMHYALDQTQPGLAVGKIYRWQVAMLCNPNRPSEDVWTEARVQRVELPAALSQALAKTSDRHQRSDLFANAGFWYDALAETLPNPRLKSEMLALLADLAKLETPAQRVPLQQIVVIEQHAKSLVQ